MFDKLANMLNKIILPVVVFGIMSLYAADIIYSLYRNGALSDGNEKELLTLVGGLVAHLITAKRE